MDQYNLEVLAKNLKIAPEHILREYYEMVLLQAFSETNLTKSVIFYGGTALRLAYAGPRFSEDLDFLMVKKFGARKLKTLLQKVCKTYPSLSLMEVKEKRNTLFALIKIQHPVLKHACHIKVEISKKKNGIQSEYRILHSSCSNFSPLIQTITLTSLEKLKLAAIKGRKEPRDWVDLWIIVNLLKKPFQAPQKFPFDQKEFKRELKRFLPSNQWTVVDTILKVATV